MDWSVGILAAVIGYVLGSISFARVINRLVAPSVEKQDHTVDHFW